MDFIGLGPLEIILILILGIIFFGTEKLPGIATKIGSIYRNYSNATSELNRNITEAVAKDEDLKAKEPSIKQENQHLDYPVNHNRDN